jgi:hypothetical protein
MPSIGSSKFNKIKGGLVMQTTLIKVNNVSGSGILYPTSDPSEIFITAKDGGYPIDAFRNHLCASGGNWIGESARGDTSPRETFVREFHEEFSFDKPMQSAEEAIAVGIATEAVSYRSIPCIKDPSEQDIRDLQQIKLLVSRKAYHVADNIQRVPRIVFDRADAANQRGDMVSLNSFYAVPLEDDEWETLERLQREFGNLSNESISLVTTLSEIVERRTPFSWGYDQIVREFFLLHGFVEANEMYLVPDITVERIDPVGTYADILTRFEVARRP